MCFDLQKMDDTSATFDAKNMMIELKVGTPNAFSAENLIVGHTSVDVPNAQDAFDYLTQKQVSWWDVCRSRCPQYCL